MDGSVRSGRSVISGMSRFSLSERDVFQMKKIISEREKADNKDIIVIRNFTVNEEIENIKEVIEVMLKERLEVIVAKLCNVEDKEKVMKNKNKLAGSRIFIENFPSFDERKREDEIAAWVKEMKDKGWQLRIGFGKIFYNNTWVRWENREDLEKRMKEDLRKTKETKAKNINIKTTCNVTESESAGATSENFS